MFTPIQTSLGALLLYQASSGLLIHNGKVFGISSLLSGSVFKPSLDNLPIIAGLVSSPLPIYLFASTLIPAYPVMPKTWASAISTLGIGALVGWGTKNGRGCTSGHMLCGLSRLSIRSVIAVGIFFTVALLTANFCADSTNIPACPAGVPCYTPSFPSSSELGFILSAVGLTGILNFLMVPRLFPRTEKSRAVFSYLAGLEFGLGLFISGMADPTKVLRFFAFLTDPARWDPSLGLIIVFGIGPSLLTWLKIRPNGQAAVKEVEQNGDAQNGDAQNGDLANEIPEHMKPTLAHQWHLPTATIADIDWRFIAGAAVFGLGWGLSGSCPGPTLLRAVIQPAWGTLALGGYLLGNFF